MTDDCSRMRKQEGGAAGMAGRVYEHRGFMLDVSRHYMPAEEIRRLLDAAKILGLNRMHWHLTDDQGWRMEIRSYPNLTETGSVRGRSYFGGTPGEERNDGFYSQQEIRDIVAYAGSLGIEVIPEIELPGHAAAMLAAYPELSCRRGEAGRWENRVEISGGIFPALVCAGKDEALALIRNVLDEVTELFPFPAVHIGGDEAVKLRWRRCPDCQARMRKLGLASEDALQRWLMLEIGAYLAEKGRRTIVWGDALAGGPLPDHFIVQQWMEGEENTRAFMAGGGQVIRSDTDYFYLDYSYGQIDVRKIWEMPGIPDYAAGYEDRLLGMECPLWTERIAGLDRAAFQLFPRLAAAALRMREPEMPWEDFRARVAELTAEVERKTGLKGAPEALWALSPAEAEKVLAAERERTRLPETAPVPGEGTLFLLDEAERLALRLGIPRAFVLKGGDSVLAGLSGPAAPEGDSGAGILMRQLMQAAESRLWGAWKRIPEEIWIETMKAFPRFISEHRRSYGYDGFDRAGWTVRQAGARIFRIGELEYELAETEARKREIGVHIPSDARLEPERLNDSLTRADAFLREFFPEWAGLPKTCESWLLSPVLKEWLPPDSRILRFQEAFDLLENLPDNDAALEWVFHVAEGQRAGLALAGLPEDTSLQKNMKALLLSGGKPGAAYGVLARPFR